MAAGIHAHTVPRRPGRIQSAHHGRANLWQNEMGRGCPWALHRNQATTSAAFVRPLGQKKCRPEGRLGAGKAVGLFGRGDEIVQPVGGGALFRGRGMNVCIQGERYLRVAEVFGYRASIDPGL